MATQTKDDILRKLTQHKQQLKGFGVARIGVFGSYARSEQNARSDIDLLVEYEEGKKTYRNFMGTADLAEEILGRDVDLVTAQSLSPHIAPFVKKEVTYVKTT